MSTLEVIVSPDAPVSLLSNSNKLLLVACDIENGVSMLGTEFHQDGIDIIMSSQQNLKKLAYYLSILEHSDPGTAN